MRGWFKDIGDIMKKSLQHLAGIIAVLAAVFIALPRCAYAEPVTNVIMTYEDKVYTKQIYGIETDRIKAGADTDALHDIGGLLNNLTFQTNGEVVVDKDLVIAVVRNAIISGSSDINIDLTKYTADIVAANTVASPAAAATADAAAIAAADPDPDSTGIDAKLSEASTKFRANEDRAKNIRNAASKINGMIIMPGQAFSCTLAFGPRTPENGYGYGNVISGDTYVKGLGGGICQVSSTLNLAMLRAGIIPVERHNHSHRSAYIASGLDATISGNSLDYKFVNPYAYPIQILANADGGVITISVYSNHNATGGIAYEPAVYGGKMSNTTHVVGKLAGVTVSDRIAYSSRYKQ